MRPISSSPRASSFEDLAPAIRNELRQLDPTECAEAWKVFGGARARHLFELSETHWLHALAWQSVGDWISPYNDQAVSPVFIQAIETAAGWSDEQPLLLIQDRKNIEMFSWQLFPECWQSLLCAFDDGPLLVPVHAVAGSIVCFAPLGHVQHAAFSAKTFSEEAR